MSTATIANNSNTAYHLQIKVQFKISK